MKKTLVFDMDGTIADLYGVKDWLSDLRAESVRPYREALPLYDMEVLNTILDLLKVNGWNIVVTTWLSMGSTKEYDERVSKAKVEWLNRMNFPYDDIHIVSYGTLKSDCTRNLGGYQILVDDNEEVRNSWDLGDTINAKENILDKLYSLLLT